MLVVNLITALLVAVQVNSQCNTTNPCQIRGGAPYQKVPEIASTGGRLDLNLSVEIGNFTYDWLTIKRRVYNGGPPGTENFICGPTWRFHPGDIVTVNLLNNLEPHNETRLHNTLRFPNRTNLHTHGLHVSSKAPSDNVFVDIDPGENFTYRYEILENHAAGTYWYHAHLHGSTMFQVQGGLAGLIIIEDPVTGSAAMPAHLAAISCPGNCEHEVPLLFQPVLQYADDNGFGRGYAQLQRSMNDSESFRHNETTSEGKTLEDWLTDSNNHIDHVTTNGILFPVLSFATGQRKRFRMVNAAGSKTLEILITEESSQNPTDACQMWEIAFDGLYLDEPRPPRLGKTFLVPASKADWIVVCNRPGNYSLQSVPSDLDSCSMGQMDRHDGLLVTLTITGAATTPSTQETALPQRPSNDLDFRNYTSDETHGHFTIEANSKQFLNREHFSEPTYYRFKSEVNTVQEWYLTNSDPDFGHPMHIHVNNFQIIEYNNYIGPVSFAGRNNTIVFYSLDEDSVCEYQSSSYYSGDTGNFTKIEFVDGSKPCIPGQVVNHTERAAAGGPGTLGYAQVGDFLDTVMVPPLSNITIRFLTDLFTGEVVIHCHILVHEDLGMMMTVDVVNQGENLTANQESGNALPGQCNSNAGSPLSKFYPLIFSALAVFVTKHWLY